MNIFLTGGSGDIGTSIKECFLKNNFMVTAPSHSELNLEDKSSIDKYFKENSAKYDIFVHCAGYNQPVESINMSIEELEKSANINYISFIEIMKYILPYMIENKYGKILAVSSLYGNFARSGRLPYVTSKHALQGAVQTFACEYGKYNIICNSLSPGFVDTKMTHKNNNDEKIKKMVSGIPLNRLASTKEIAEIVYYLCSDKNSYITGQNIIADGGCMACGGMYSL